MWKSSVSGVFRYLARASPSARPPKPTIRPRSSAIGNISRWRKWAKGSPPSSALTSPAASSSASPKPWPSSARRSALPLVGRVAQLEGADGRPVEPAPLEIGHAPPGPAMPASWAWNQADAAALAACSRWPDSACAWDCAVRRGAGTPVSSASRSSASAKLRPSMLHDEVDGGAVRAAAEAVIEALVLDHVERGRLLLVERAQAQMLAAAPRQLDVAADDLDQRQAGLEFLERGVGSGQSATFGLLDASGHHDTKRSIRARHGLRGT